MAEVIETVGRVLNGRLDLHKDALRALNQGIKPWEGKTVRVVVRPARRTRTSAQNAYLWSTVYGYIAEHTGHTPEEIHEWAKQEFLPKTVAFADGNGVVVGERVIGGSTTALNTVEMTDFIEAIRTFARDRLGVVVPDPGEW